MVRVVHLVAVISLGLAPASAGARRTFSRCVTKHPPAGDGYLLAEHTTHMSPGAHSRVANVRRAADRLDGAVIPPGGTLSYDRQVGPRDQESGFLPAPVIDRGRMVDLAGGGACQPSSTLHAAALFAGLDIVERREHSMVSAYIAPGLDAAVVYGHKDLVIRNPYRFDVRVAAEAERSRLTIRLLGAGPRRGYTRVETTVVKRRRHKIVIEVDPSLTSGDYLVDVFGLDGLRVARKRRTMDRHGRTVRLERLSDDFYYPRDEVVRVGPDRGARTAEANQAPYR